MMNLLVTVVYFSEYKYANEERCKIQGEYRETHSN